MDHPSHWIVQYLWLIPALPFLAAGLTALMKRRAKALSSGLVILAMAGSFILSLVAISQVIGGDHGAEAIAPKIFNFTWFEYGNSAIRLGFLLDPLSAMMLFVVSFVSLLVFIFSAGYMDHDENFTRFFTFLSLFAGSMLLLVIANSLLLLFMAWELVGLSSFLLIGFWFNKPSAAAAMKKAFITTRIGDLGFFIGLVWFYHQTGSSLFYDNGQGALETAKLAAIGGSAALTISLLIFCGAAGKSGQFPLHVWLPDAMEGPTPVSALIHAATMVAAGVFLVGRMYPVFSINETALLVVAMVGAFTALMAATIALAQWDIKRILAYSTVSQLGYMMMGLGVGGYVAGTFHLFTHAFFKALLFLGSGSIIYACHHEQDIREMGGLRSKMPWTFLTYGIGMIALAGLPPFAGFFSKDEILLSAWHYHPAGISPIIAKIPFWCGLIGAFLTAFYMTRQMKYVFFGHGRGHGAEHAHENRAVMLMPLILLAFMSVAAGFLGVPDHLFGLDVSNWFHHFLQPSAHGHEINYAVMGGSTLIVIFAILAGNAVYSGKALTKGAVDPLERTAPGLFRVLNNKYYIDELYEATFIRLTHAWARITVVFDRYILNGLFVLGSSAFIYILSMINQAIDDIAINGGFDKSCQGVRKGGQLNRWIQNGFSQHYLKIAAIGVVALFILAAFFTN
jgi:NADH-quinone oxidoreductase subunit L